MSRNPDDRAHPDGLPVDDEFEAIVSGWRQEGRVPVWPDEQRGPAALFEPFEPDLTEFGRPETSHPDPGRPETGWPEAAGEQRPGPRPAEPVRPYPPRPEHPADDHYVPPEPPPLPRIGPPAAVGMVLVGTGLLMLVSPSWLGLPDRYGLPLGLVGIAAGLGWLVLRLWPDAPSADDDPDPDNGAVL